jgi:tetratricopeptide (TPR) repeat protein
MKNLNIALLIIAFLTLNTTALFAQVDSAKTLVEEGIKLNDAGKYIDAMAKYSEALKVNPTFVRADYEMGYTLYASGNGMSAIPYLETVLKGGGYTDEACDLLASIYDDNHQPDKAIEYYKKGIAFNPKAERLHFNLGITYARQKRYAEAEICEMEAIKLDPTHASAQREYGLDAYYMGNKAVAVMALCNFLLLEPQTARSKVVYGYLEKIFSNEIGQNNISVSMDKGSKEISPLSMINMSVNLAARTREELIKKNADSVASLEFALKMVFESAGKESAKLNTSKSFYWNYYADFFYKLAESDNMAAFTRLISLSAFKEQNLAWFKDNKKQLDDLDIWVRSTPRNLDGE